MVSAPSLLRLALIASVVPFVLSSCSTEGLERDIAKAEHAGDVYALRKAETESERFALLGPAARSALDVGKEEQAEQFAEELERMMPTHHNDPKYGEAVHYAHIVLGRIALMHGDFAGAVSHLLAAGHTSGSPYLDSYGPNMSLARELLVRGERQAVLQYLDLCERFWEDDGFGRIAHWKAEIEAGKIPDFGGNLTA